MKNNKNIPFINRKMWPFEILVGLFIVMVVFILSKNVDMNRAEVTLRSNVEYIKEQCNNYNRLNLASETRSLMRVIESARQVKKSVKYEEQFSEDKTLNREQLENLVRDNYVTGVIIMNADGSVENQYYTDELGEKGLSEELSNQALLDVAGFPEKSYSARVNYKDGSYIDLGACGSDDGTKIIVTYYHTPEEYISKFNLSFDMLLDGYGIENDGTIAITSGDTIIASNNKKLIGSSVNNSQVMKRLKDSVGSGKLLHANGDSGTIARNFGLIERGRDYYVYAYLPEKSVFTTTIRNVIYTLILYIFALAVLSMVRWKTAQGYQKERTRIQEKYAQELQHKNEQLEQAVNREIKANAAKTNFLSRMTHDIRTPLNGIIGLLKIDEAHSDDLELMHANRKKMLVSANHLLSLINDMLQMSKLEDDEVVLVHEVLDLNELSADIMTIVSQRAADAGVTLEYEKNSDKIIYPYVYGSPLHIRQLFLNIYGNSIKYNKVGGKVRTEFEYLGSENGKVTYQWMIADTGIGMSKEFLEHIFEPFAQEKSDARSVYQGTGLGMAIVKSLVDKMNGTIKVTSVQGEGSTFVIQIPFEIAERKDIVENKKESEKASIRGMHLLLAEDNDLNAEIAEVLFADEGAEITIARNGQEAIDRFAQNPEGTFDAILMDIMMPLVDGYSATRSIRAMERKDAKEIPIIAMTANAFAEDATKCFEAGMNAHLSKPLQMETVVATIAKYCTEK